MDLGILEEVGLSPNEAKIYQTLVNSGICSIVKLSVESNIHRRNVYDCVDKLVRKGLAVDEFVEGTRFVRAIQPSRLLDIVHETEARVQTVLPELQAQFDRKRLGEEAGIYRGIQGFKTYLADILTQNQPVYFIGAKGFWLDERLKYFFPKFDAQRIRQGISFKHIYDFEVKTQVPEILNLKLNEYKFFPPEFSSSIAVDIFGDHVVTFYGVSPGKLSDEPVQYTVISQKIADGYRKYFEFMWERLDLPNFK